ncbi:hypothetical protein [Stakelama saccharophila]|uniref:DUF4267 domain-containing protein n=1 Tax=Stakelama saccharophila TaxID=3075605 RepID=A0ABZ0B683_9SPHN|nr:hypothetical protein [Stakelama sp. W311]WNO52707.1 hypothetical protein RPR59_09540 [Stakelama sp. W311]
MNYKKMSRVLGWFSIGLGAVELLAGKRIAKALDAEGHSRTVRAFGGREIASGVALLQAPAHAARVWGRVAGDALDLGALALAARHSPKNKAIWGAAAFVLGAAALDTLVARGLSGSAADPSAHKALPA